MLYAENQLIIASKKAVSKTTAFFDAIKWTLS